MRKMVLSLLLPVSCAFSHAQESGIVWKRSISRPIELFHGRGDRNELGTKIIAAVKTGKILAYIREGDGSLRKMDPTELPQAFVPPNDTVVVDDKVHNKTIYQIIRRELKPDSLHHFITLEDWKYSPAGDSIIGRVTHLAVAYEVHDADGRGSGKWKALFWIKYEDAATLGREETGRLKEILDERIWAGKFESISHNYTTSIMDMHTAKDATENCCVEEYNDSPLSAMMVADVRDNKIPAWTSSDDNPIDNKLTNEEILTQTTHTDTIYDPTNRACYGVIRTELDYARVNRYMIGEEWSSDVATGEITVRIRKIAPVQQGYGKGRDRVLFWMRYNDVLPMLKRMEERHPEHTLQMRIWAAMFIK